jgi:hypothetical protein
MLGVDRCQQEVKNKREGNKKQLRDLCSSINWLICEAFGALLGID